MALATHSFSFLVRLREKIVVLATLARNVITVCTNHLASLAFRKLAHVDPNLFFLPSTKFTSVHVCLVASYHRLSSVCLGTDRKLSPETLVASRNARVGHHASLHKL